jgi:hypothetical protein
MLRTGRLRTPKGRSSLHFDTGLSTDAGSPATEDSGVSSDRTRTGWLP